MLPVAVIALDGALASSVAITIDVMAMANHCCRHAGRPPAFEVRLVGSGAPLFRPFLAFPEGTSDTHALVVVPAQGFSKAPDYAKRLADPDAGQARDLLRRAVEGGAHIASSCTGTLLVASAGLLDGRTATTAWWLAPVFGDLFPSVRLDTSRLVLTDGLLTTAGAAMAQMDLMVQLVARHASGEIADQCARRMVLDDRRSQTPYMAMGLLAASNRAVATAADWARSRLGQPIGVEDLARAAGQSPRTFARRVSATTGLSPVRFLQALRVERAIELLQTTEDSFESIAYVVGYSDPSTLRALVRKTAGMGPRDLRAHQRSAPSSG